MKRIKLVLALFTTLVISFTGAETSQKGTAYLGEDVLWRPREWIIFNMFNEQGSEFNLNFTVRDMNTYVHAPAPVFFCVIGPNSTIVTRQFLEDDGITGGNFKYQDGIYDPYADFRYRQYHRANTPGGYPDGKMRSPFLDHPEKLPARKVSIKVPACGKGLYRVVVAGRWDHWISVTPDRLMPTGVNPGSGPLYVQGTNLKESFFYVPEQSTDIGLMVTEEMEPYKAGMTLKDPEGKVIKSVKASGFATFIMVNPKEKDAVYKLEIESNTSGVCLHGKGFPFVLCPDKETAMLLRGGMEVDNKGRVTYHQCIRDIDQWLDSLKQSDLNVNIKLSAKEQKVELTASAGITDYKVTLGQIDILIKSQDIDPGSTTFGKISGKAGRFDPAALLALAAGSQQKNNPYYANKALIKRVLLANSSQIRQLNPELRFMNNVLPWNKKEKITHYFNLPARSNWYGLGLDAKSATSLQLLNGVVDTGLPVKVDEAWKNAFRLWAAGRANMHVGEVANQWGWNFMIMKMIYLGTSDKEIEELMHRHAKLVSTPNLYGRFNPDRTPFDIKKGKLDIDCGLTPSGYMPEQMGFDGEYSCEQTLLWGKVWQQIKAPGIVKWFNSFNKLKTHLTLSKTGNAPKVCFSETCSPTDINFRTRYMTHKNHQPEEMKGQVQYLDLWFPEKNKKPEKTWPFLEKDSFTRVIDDKFFFIKKTNYYTILYGGPRLPAFANWSAGTISGDSMNFNGYEGSGYGMWGSNANKVGGISAIYINNCGPVSFGQNHSVMDSNTVWGKALKPLYKTWRKEDVDPTIFASSYCQPEVQFNQNKMEYTISEKIDFVPLKVKRIFTFLDNKIKIDMEIHALDNFTCKELNYSIPFFADNRVISADGKVINIPEPLTTIERPRYPDLKLEKSRWELDTFKASQISVTSTNGKGVEYLFEKELNIRPLRPFRYRKIAAAGGSFVITLPEQMKKNEKYELNYTINIK